MPFDYLSLELEPIAGGVPAWRASLHPGQLRECCTRAASRGARLAALWGSDERDRGEGYALQLALASGEGLLWLTVALPAEQPAYPGLSDIFYCANRMQRAARDLVGIRALPSVDGQDVDSRPWPRHGAWPEDAYPLRRDPEQAHVPTQDRYAFVPVEGEGVHEIAVGPVHAGTIEPGHFRFSVVGEKVLRLEVRLGYTHKGIEKRFEGMSLAQGARLAGRVSGDSTVAYAWAYAMAVESIAGVTPPERALLLRALLLERERIANHLGDLGALGNDGGLAFGLAQFLRLKEDLLRLNARLFGHRYLMDSVVPGGVARDVDHAGIAALDEQCDALETELRTLRVIYDEHAGLQDRFITCGRLTPEMAARLGVIGLAGRASAQGWDARVKPGFAPYDDLAPRLVTHRNGDVAARVTVRFEEIAESLRLVRAVIERIAPGAIAATVAAPAGQALGIGRVEGWRGEVLIALETSGDSVRRCHPHDPSWQVWPAIEHAVMGNIVPDFPLINKSFNLSYSGQDL
jgi:Ni,Fe-hydrogenase III large subunit/Ni,Fe-hydrogenase III component G